MLNFGSMKPFDVINVGGLMGTSNRIERALHARGNVRFVTTVYPTPASAALEDPQDGVTRLIAMIEEKVADIRRQFGEPRVKLVGLSNGSCQALMAAVQTNFRDILSVMSIEGPLHPDVPVAPPLRIPLLFACTKHYARRPELMRQAYHYLVTNDMMARVTILRGSAQDDVVPLEAQIFPGDFHGRLVTFPESIDHDDASVKAMLFPKAYSKHLFWSDAKMAMACEVIEMDEEDAAIAMSA